MVNNSRQQIIDRIISDTLADKVEWTCGSHSDLHSASGPGYTLTELAKGLINTYFMLEFTTESRPGYGQIWFTWLEWRRLQYARSRHRRHLPMLKIAELLLHENHQQVP